MDQEQPLICEQVVLLFVNISYCCLPMPPLHSLKTYNCYKLAMKIMNMYKINHDIHYINSGHLAFEEPLGIAEEGRYRQMSSCHQKQVSKQ